MYFEIENTPETLKRHRKKEKVHEVEQEECPRLTLAPFSRPPQVVFDNVLVGTTCEKELEVFNPLKHAQQITLSRPLPPGLVIHLAEDCLELEPQTCYCMTMTWTPTQLVSRRDTIRFNNDNRGRHDVIIVMKSIVPTKKNAGPKFKTSPGKIKKKTSKRSPVYKKKMEAVRSSVTVKNAVNIVESTQFRFVNPTNKENTCSNDYSMDSNYKKCPFKSPSSLEFNTSEVFANMLHSKPAILHDTYDKHSALKCEKSQLVPGNILKPSNKQLSEISVSDVFDNLTFTPLKSVPFKNEKLEKGPRIIISVNSESDFDDSLDIKSDNKENETHSIICVTSSQQPTQWLTGDPAHVCETPVMNKKVPNTSSPKDMEIPNFSINTDFSRISDLSFFPQRFSTERKCFPKVNNESHEIVDDSNMNLKLSPDTFTKESPNTPVDYRLNKNRLESQNLPSLAKEPYVARDPKLCRQSLFKEQHNFRELNERNYLALPEHYPWHSDLRADIKSPPRSLTPPLQSIPEESMHFSDTQMLDKTDKQFATFTINQTFDKPSDLSSVSAKTQSTWSKRAVRAEPALWQIPAHVARKPMKQKTSITMKESLSDKKNITLETNRSINQSSYLNYVGNVYSQASTVDPFLSSTYYYDKEAVENFQEECKRWLNCVLTPPADLDSNIDQKIDVGKAWLENRNKEVPLAPTKEQVSSKYHNSKRLESLRRSARELLLSPEMSQVFNKLQAQLEKKLIVIRNDKNLHLDIGLQKMIMEIILSYNPLWLRIGLETIYGVVLPLKSNNDIEGLTTFIIQKMFKNPSLMNKHSKTAMPNMLRPAYMEAIKKYTLKKFFMLVYFLDQAKQKKIIPHDPCLFRRNAPYKESKAIIINFTKELIAGIGDITKHLRPLGYVVSHKQSYLDEFTYAVHNIAVDIRDGVRLTKVMEIILMRSGLLHQLRTPAISRLQKIHNVQVALNALKDADFTIVGDISAADIADGHREKTLSLLWQLIHVFRAPLFEKSANVIQAWWRKKYKVIIEKRKEEERLLERLTTAASKIQCWWRRIQYNRMVEDQMHKMTIATITLQKYWRGWLYRNRLRKLKSSVAKISEWYKNIKLKRQAIETLQILRSQREELRHKSATLIQAHVRRWLCVKRYKTITLKLILIQSIIRRFLAQRQYNNLKKAATLVQRKYRGKILMRKEMQNLTVKRNCVIRIQSYYRMSKQRKYYKDLKKSVLTIETHYISLISMRRDRMNYLRLKEVTIKVQASYRRNKMRAEYLRQRNIIVKMQRKVRANQAMRKDRANYLKIRNAAIVIQNRTRAYQAMKVAKAKYILQKNSAITIQRYYRAYLQKKTQRSSYLLLRKSVICIQTRYRSVLEMRHQRNSYLKLRNSVLLVQRRFRAKILTRETQNKYQEIRKAALVLQRRFRALLEMRKERLKYTKIKSACITIQNVFRAHLKRKEQRAIYLKQREMAIRIQRWYRSLKKTQEVKQHYLETKRACTTIQTMYKAYIAGKKQRQQFIKMKAATVYIQKYYRTYLLTKTIRKEFLEIRKSTVVIQQYYRSWLETKKHRQTYLKIRQATITIQVHYKQYRVTKLTRQEYCKLKSATICVQQRYRSIVAMRKDLKYYMNLKRCTINIQRRFRAILAMRKQKQEYSRQRSVIIDFQKRFKALYYMKKERSKYLRLLQACRTIQMHYRAYREGNEQRKQFVQRRIRAKNEARMTLRKLAVHKIQMWYISIKQRNECRSHFIDIRTNIITIQKTFRAYIARKRYLYKRQAAITIQRYYRRYKLAKLEREKYIKLRRSVIKLQAHTREFIQRRRYLRLRQTVQIIQAIYRFKKLRALMQQRRSEAALCIQKNVRRYLAQSKYRRFREKLIFVQLLWRNKLITRHIRCEFLRKRSLVLKLQAVIRGYLVRKEFESKKENLLKLKEEQRKNWAASKIQALFRGDMVRKCAGERAAALRRRWRGGALQSRQESLHDRHIEALEVLWRMSDIQRVIRALNSLQLLTEVMPMLYGGCAAGLARRVDMCMSLVNRSVSSVEVLTACAAVLVNLARYRVTGPKIYERDRITRTLRYMNRFTISNPQLFCMLCTYIWLFSKYAAIKKDLTEYLRKPDNLKILVNIKKDVGRRKRMESNKNKYNTQQQSKTFSRTMDQSLLDTVNSSIFSTSSSQSSTSNSSLLPALEPDYGIVRIDKPRYFEDSQQAINCLLEVYGLADLT